MKIEVDCLMFTGIQFHFIQILMTSLARTGEEHVFECDKWFSNKDEGNQSVIEFPAMRKGSPVAKGIMKHCAKLLHFLHVFQVMLYCIHTDTVKPALSKPV